VSALYRVARLHVGRRPSRRRRWERYEAAPVGFGLFLFLGVFVTMAGLFALFAARNLFDVAVTALHRVLTP